MMDASMQPVGIDVAKKTLEIALLCGSRVLRKKAANHPKEFASLLTWMREQAQGTLHVCLEPTGTYHDALLAFLLEQGVTVSLVPASRLAAFRRSEGIRQKTDRHDALLLASFGQQKHPAACVAVPEDLGQLRVWLARLQSLQDMRQQERNRLENGRLPQSLREQITEHLRLLDDWRGQLKKEIRSWIKEHDEMQRAVKLLQSLKGIGELSAWSLLAVMGPDASRFASASQLAVYVGLDVVQHESGTSVKRVGHISKQGSPRVRRVLGMAAIVAKRWDADMAQWASELSSRGKKSRVVRVALMRKLLFLAYGVLKSQQPYDRQRAWPTHQPLVQQEEQAA